MGLVNLRDADPETVWLAGIFEGEGCINGYWYKDPRLPTSGPWYAARVEVQMSDEDVIRQVLEVAGRGSFYSYQQRKLKVNGDLCQLMWCWKVSNQAGFQAITQRLYPYLGHRRRAKIEEIYREAPWIHEPYFFEEASL